MVMQELKRVSADKDELKKKHDEAQDKLAQVQEELDKVKAGKSGDDAAAEDTDKPTADSATTDTKEDKAPEKVKSPVASVIGMFSPKQKAQAVEEKTDRKS